MHVADQLIANFRRIAAADGSDICLLEATDQRIRVGYTPGTEETCEAGSCTLPQAELEDMMRGWLARMAPDMKLTIEAATA